MKPPEDESNEPGEGDEEKTTTKFPASVLKIVPQLLLGGTTKPAQDLSIFLKTEANLLIGTPGRLLEIVSSSHVHCPQSSFEVLVLDEADRLLDLGFKDDLQQIIRRLPKQRRTGLFSASVSEAVDQLIRVGLRNPVRITVKVKSSLSAGAAEIRTPASLSLTYLVMPPNHRLPALRRILTSLSPMPQKTIVYLSTCAAVDYFSTILSTVLPKSIAIITLHGKHPPSVRTKNFTRFVNSLTPTLLLTTDLAARGLDIPAVDLVAQIDPPVDPKSFLHRCGRTGRAGRAGLSILFLNPGREEDYIPFLAVRGTPVVPLTSTPDFASNSLEISQAEAAAATADIRRALLHDRALHDRAQRAFVSWVRAYTKHVAASIFRVTDLDWDVLADAWGLLRMPKMPEAKGWKGDRGLGLGVDWDAFAYRDKAKEKKRLEELEEFRRGLRERDTEDVQGGANYLNERQRGSNKRDAKRKAEPAQAWSLKKGQRVERDTRREKKKAKREHTRQMQMTQEEKDRQAQLVSAIQEIRQKNSIEEEEFNGFED